MSAPDPELLEWVVRSAAPGAAVTEVRGLRDGGSPWLVRLDDRGVVLRVGDAADPSPLRTEVAALRLAAQHDIVVPELLAAALDADPPRVLTGQIVGSSTIPAVRPTTRLRRLGAAAAELHAVVREPEPELPLRDRPISGVDFTALRRQQPPDPLLVEAEERVAAYELRPAATVFVHGDLWQGNTMWVGDDLAGLIDWDCAGVGAPGVDLGSLRCDAALCFGIEAADDIQDGWQQATGRAADDVAYWDLVAALSTPPDMGWFTAAISGQGRPDLTQQLLVDRRDAFIRAALQST